MRCSLGVLVWLLASSALAAEAESNSGSVAVAVHATEDGSTTGDAPGADDAFGRAAAVLRRYQTALGRQQAGRTGYRSRNKTYRDVSGAFPAFARPFMRGAQQLIAGLLGLVDQGSAYNRRTPTGPPPQSVQEAVASVRELAAGGHGEAQLELAMTELYGRYGVTVDPKAAFERCQRLAEASGDAAAQYMLGIFYATGMGGVEQQNSLALLYTTLAAMQGHTAAEATLAFKHLSGIGVPVSCDKALGYYQTVARKAIQHYLAGPPLGRQMPEYRVRLADDNGGTYGVKTGPYSLHKAIDRQAFGDLLQYHQQNAREGDLKSCITLVDLYYHGHRFGAANFSTALRYVRTMQDRLFTARGELRPGLAAGEAGMAAQAAGMLGIMHLRGEGTAVDTAAAQRWLTIGARLDHAQSLNALGVMYQEGLGVAANAERAIQLFKRAAEQRHLGGLANYGLAMLDTSPAAAHESLKKAAEGGHLLAHYHLAELYAGMASSETQCRMAVASYKFVAENGDWLHSPMPEAAAAYHRGDLDAATVDYIRAAEMGYGAGQQNAALLLEAAAKRVGAAEGPDAWPLFGSRQAHVWQTLAYWTRAANQNMPDARAKQGDYYYHGWGVERSAEQAAAAYTLAAEADANGLAMWSLGWMHENGIGVKRDFHLAKRWYDKSIEANQDGRLANHISLARLAVKYLWAWASGEDVGDAPLFFAPEPEPHEEYDYGDDGDDDAVGHAAADGDDGAAADAHAGQLRPARQAPGGDWEQDPAAADADDFGMGGDEEAGDGDGDETLSGNIFFVVLLLAAGGMFLPFR